MGVHLKETPLSFRRKNKHPLAKLIKLTEKEMEQTIENLVALAAQKEDLKVALGANKEIAQIHIDAVNAMEKDDITRTLAEIKLNGPKQLEMVDEDDTPQISFTVDDE